MLLIMIYLTLINLIQGIPMQQDRPHKVVAVELTDIRSKEGKILISLYNDPESFPDNEKMMEQKILADIPGETMTVRFKKLSPGSYAIAAMHDENGDEKMNFNLLGMPKEGYCFSNNVRPKWRKPHWKEAKFEVSRRDTLLRIEMKY